MAVHGTERRWPMRLGTLGSLCFVSTALAAEAPGAWSAWTASPVFVDPAGLSPVERQVLGQCGGTDAGLQETARAVLESKLRGLPMPEFDDIARIQRGAGEPHPWARAWVASGPKLGEFATMASLHSWLGPSPRGAERRCGVASGTRDGAQALAVVSIDALADLAPLPTRVRPGEWLTVQARMLVHATGGDVIVLGPGGAPRSLPTSFDGAVLRARFAPDRSGEFEVQVMADVAGGPRPVIEATVFAGVEPAAPDATRPAPGEDRTGDGLEDDERLAAMIRAAREAPGLPSLLRDRRLDDVARKHAVRMARAGQLAHDAGDGDPFDRLRESGIDARYGGENVAHAPTVSLAHRALWDSPSHRANLLRREFDRVGVGVVRDDRGDAWVVETFAGK
jgi:uncharacterized protein YkwD